MLDNAGRLDACDRKHDYRIVGQLGGKFQGIIRSQLACFAMFDELPHMALWEVGDSEEEGVEI